MLSAIKEKIFHLFRKRTDKSSYLNSSFQSPAQPFLKKSVQFRFKGVAYKVKVGTLVSLVVLCIAMVGVVSAFFLSQQEQDLRQQASGTCRVYCNCGAGAFCADDKGAGVTRTCNQICQAEPQPTQPPVAQPTNQPNPINPGINNNCSPNFPTASGCINSSIDGVCTNVANALCRYTTTDQSNGQKFCACVPLSTDIAPTPLPTPPASCTSPNVCRYGSCYSGEIIITGSSCAGGGTCCKTSSGTGGAGTASCLSKIGMIAHNTNSSGGCDTDTCGASAKPVYFCNNGSLNTVCSSVGCQNPTCPNGSTVIRGGREDGACRCASGSVVNPGGNCPVVSTPPATQPPVTQLSPTQPPATQSPTTQPRSIIPGEICPSGNVACICGGATVSVGSRCPFCENSRCLKGCSENTSNGGICNPFCLENIQSICRELKRSCVANAVGGACSFAAPQQVAVIPAKTIVPVVAIISINDTPDIPAATRRVTTSSPTPSSGPLAQISSPNPLQAQNVEEVDRVVQSPSPTTRPVARIVTTNYYTCNQNGQCVAATQGTNLSTCRQECQPAATPTPTPTPSVFFVTRPNNRPLIAGAVCNPGGTVGLLYAGLPECYSCPDPNQVAWNQGPFGINTNPRCGIPQAVKVAREIATRDAYPDVAPVLTSVAAPLACAGSGQFLASTQVCCSGLQPQSLPTFLRFISNRSVCAPVIISSLPPTATEVLTGEPIEYSTVATPRFRYASVKVDSVRYETMAITDKSGISIGERCRSTQGCVIAINGDYYDQNTLERQGPSFEDNEWRSGNVPNWQTPVLVTFSNGRSTILTDCETRPAGSGSCTINGGLHSGERVFPDSSQVQSATSGWPQLMNDGVILDPCPSDGSTCDNFTSTQTYRSIAAVDTNGNTVYLTFYGNLLGDARNIVENYNLTNPDSPIEDAINMDGGSSSQLYVLDGGELVGTNTGSDRNPVTAILIIDPVLAQQAEGSL